MSSIVVSEPFRTLWKSGAQQQAEALSTLLQEYSLPPPVTEQEPYPEEFDAVLSCVIPFVSSGTVTSGTLAVTAAAHAASYGIPPASMAPIYYLSGMSEVSVDDRVLALQIPDRVGTPLINIAPFPINVPNVPRFRAMPESFRNRILFSSFDNMLLDFRSFSSVEQREEFIQTGYCQIAPQYVSATEGWCTLQYTSNMRYTGCFRFPTPAELDTYFAAIPNGAALKIGPYGPDDFFTAFGIRASDIRAAWQPEARVVEPRPGTATNVQAQDFSGEPRRRPARREVFASTATRRRASVSITPPQAAPMYGGVMRSNVIQNVMRDAVPEPLTPLSATRRDDEGDIMDSEAFESLPTPLQWSHPAMNPSFNEARNSQSLPPTTSPGAQEPGEL